tara:strand:+ start:146 stop:364 length:219 start_codon:yes stop_codon:yes gene_type:complete
MFVETVNQGCGSSPSPSTPRAQKNEITQDIQQVPATRSSPRWQTRMAGADEALSSESLGAAGLVATEAASAD